MARSPGDPTLEAVVENLRYLASTCCWPPLRHGHRTVRWRQCPRCDETAGTAGRLLLLGWLSLPCQVRVSDTSLEPPGAAGQREAALGRRTTRPRGTHTRFHSFRTIASSLVKRCAVRLPVRSIPNHAGCGTVRRTRRTLNALTISTPCSSANASHTLLNAPWSISVPMTSGTTAWPMSRPE